MPSIPEAPRLLSATPGRVRVFVPGWNLGTKISLERHIRALPGVRSAEANPLTSNVLVRFDESKLPRARLLEALQAIETHRLEPGHTQQDDSRPTAIADKAGPQRRVRVTVRGLDRDPELGRKVVERLQERHGVRATASPLTGRVLIEYGHKLIKLENILCEIEELELPGLPGEDRPRHPLDPAPLVQSFTRVLGVAVGLGFVVVRRLMEVKGSPQTISSAARAAGLLGLVQAFPSVRSGLRMLFGRSASDLMLYIPVMASLALSESVLGLAVTGIESMRLLTEILMRRAAFRRYEDRLGDCPSTHPGAVVRVDSGNRAQRSGEIIEGNGVVVTRDGLPRSVKPGDVVNAGARMYGGPFVLELHSAESFSPRTRPEEPRSRLYDRYVASLGIASLAYAGLNAVLRRSFAGVLESFLLVNPRAAVIASDLGDVGAFARILRAGVIVVGTRQHRTIRKPDLLLLDNPRIVTAGLDISRVVTLTDIYDGHEVVGRATSVAAASGGLWGGALSTLTARPAEEGIFEERCAFATIDGRRWRVGACDDLSEVAPALRMLHRGEAALLVAEEDGPHGWRNVGVIFLRPRLAPGLDGLVGLCKKSGVEVALLVGKDVAAAEAVASRANIPLIRDRAAIDVIRERQERGQRVFFVSDHAHSGEAFANCDLAIAISAGRSGRFEARADLLSPDLGGVTAIIDASVRRHRAVMGGLFASVVGNVFGAIWGMRTMVRPEQAAQPVYTAAVAAFLFGAWCMRGGERQRSVLLDLADPHPEKWGARSIESVLTSVNASSHGLTTALAKKRRPRHVAPPRIDELWKTLLDQFRSPLPGILVAAGGIALFLGAYLDFAVIAGTLAVNVVVGAWQERQAGRAAEAMKRVAAPAARVLRDGRTIMLGVVEVVPGDVLVLAPGDRISADARVLSAHALEVDEASLTGESNPVPKAPHAFDHAQRVVLEGSDVVCGHGRAVVFATGRQTRLGATAAALALDESQGTPLGLRLGRLLRQLLPLATAGGGVVLLSGFLRSQPFLPTLAVAASIALAAVPEGLPLLAGVGQVAVSKRLARRNALVRRLSAVEALGRVDVACTDKTGTLTEGKLRVAVVADLVNEHDLRDAPGRDRQVTRDAGVRKSHELQIQSVRKELTRPLSQVLLVAAWASPHPDAADASAHPTDVAVLRAADHADLGRAVRLSRERWAPFDPARSFHASLVDGRLRLKGAPEVIAGLCTSVRVEGIEKGLDETLRRKLLERADALAQRGLRILMVAEGSGDLEPDRPRELVALGYVGIQDPLRDDAPAAIENCHKAGIRVIMLTGDHPSTARAIAREAGLAIDGSDLLTGSDIEQMSEEELDRRMEQVTVIARATPLDKLRIIEGLQRRGHTVAMTGDGVNDAPALRLADVGVAMGRGGTEVARQAADLILCDDDFATLVAALIEGRSFWRNTRRALGLLLGGNLGELGLVVGSSVLGFPAPLTVRQILAVNLITDALPAMSIVLQKPEHKHLASLSREGLQAVDVSLRTDALRRSIATAVPAIVNYFLLMRNGGGVVGARTVAFSSIVVTQLAQTLDAGLQSGTVTQPVVKAVGASSALLAATLVVPPLQALFALSMPASGWLLAGVSGIAAVAINRLLAALGVSAVSAVAPRHKALPAEPAVAPRAL